MLFLMTGAQRRCLFFQGWQAADFEGCADPVGCGALTSDRWQIQLLPRVANVQ